MLAFQAWDEGSIPFFCSKNRCSNTKERNDISSEMVSDAISKCKNSSIGRAWACQVQGCGFKPRFLLILVFDTDLPLGDGTWRGALNTLCSRNRIQMGYDGCRERHKCRCSAVEARPPLRVSEGSIPSVCSNMGGLKWIGKNFILTKNEYSKKTQNFKQYVKLQNVGATPTPPTNYM